MNARQGRKTYAAEAIEPFRDRLKPSYFAILMLRSAGDYESVAATLSVPLGTVKSRLHRATVALERLISSNQKD